MGGYLLLFPQARIRTLGRGGVYHVPAWMMLGFWILTQVLAGMGQWGGDEMGASPTRRTSAASSPAWSWCACSPPVAG
jgi:hypothetical protein